MYFGGVRKDISFEIDLQKKAGGKIFIFDPSPTGKETIKRIKLPRGTKFIPKGPSRKTQILNFQVPKNSAEGPFTVVGGRPTHKFECTSVTDFAKKWTHENKFTKYGQV